MALPNVQEVIKDGGLGVISTANAGVFGMEGNASAGTVETLYAIGDPATAEDTFEAGTLVERILDAFANGATRIIACRVDTAGTPPPFPSGTGTVTTTEPQKRRFQTQDRRRHDNGSLTAGGIKIKISRPILAMRLRCHRHAVNHSPWQRVGGAGGRCRRRELGPDMSGRGHPLRQSPPPRKSSMPSKSWLKITRFPGFTSPTPRIRPSGPPFQPSMPPSRQGINTSGSWRRQMIPQAQRLRLNG
jgi:hypothetical protein